MRVKLGVLRIDEHTWAGGTPQRRHEWRVCLDELIHEGRFEWGGPPAEGLEAPLSGLFTLTPSRVLFHVSTADGAPLVEHALPLRQVEPLMEEYLSTCREMSKLGVGSRSPRLEALDIAKRLTHDEAGELMVSLLPTLKPDHGTGRRIFTLLVTLYHDTSKLGAQPHLRY
jgi:uncharacterized protein (UPF0262 family)